MNLKARAKELVSDHFSSIKPDDTKHCEVRAEDMINLYEEIIQLAKEYGDNISINAGEV